ncbi:unnamed protein product [Closterium sp. NIES-65]|nr:unnamed protein product [Closterium sp. NIES-65]
MAGGDMLPLPPHFHPLQELWPSLFTPSALSLPSQQLAESLFDVAGFAVFATLYAFAISFVFPCPPHQPLLLGKMSLQMRRSDGSAVAARPNSIRLPPPQRLRNSLLLSPIAPRYINFAGVMGVLWPLALIASGYYLRKSIPEFTWALSLVLPDMLLLVIQNIQVLPPLGHPRIHLGSLPRPLWYAAARHPELLFPHSTTPSARSLSLQVAHALCCCLHSLSLFSLTPFSFPYPTPTYSACRALVPPLYNARRMFSLYKWLTHSAAAVLPLILSSTARAGSGSVWRLVWLGALVACAGALAVLRWVFTCVFMVLGASTERVGKCSVWHLVWLGALVACAGALPVLRWVFTCVFMELGASTAEGGQWQCVAPGVAGDAGSVCSCELPAVGYNIFCFLLPTVVPHRHLSTCSCPLSPSPPLLQLPAVNYLLWAYNIFCFLLPTVVPRIFEQDITSRAAASGTDRVEAVGGSSGGKGKKGPTQPTIPLPLSRGQDHILPLPSAPQLLRQSFIHVKSSLQYSGRQCTVD